MPTFGIQGLDVSGHQPSVDWQQQWNMGARFAYVKASEGNYFTNDYFNSQYQGSRNVGMIRGAYHFAIPNWSSGADQARYFVQNGGGWSADGYTMPPVLDFEFNPYEGRTINGFYFGNTCYGMSPAQLGSWVRDFGSTMQALTGRLPVIYTNTSWWNQCLGNPAGFGDYPLWIAAYPSSATNNAGPVPTSSWGTYSMWQYSSTGPLAGDSNVWNGDSQQLAAFATGAFPSNRAVLARSATNPTLYYVSASKKYPISDWGTYLQLSTFAGEFQTVRQADLDNVVTGRSATRFVRSDDGSIYLMDSGRRFHVSSCEQMRDFGGGLCEAWLPVPADQLAGVPVAGVLSNLVTTNAGQTYYIAGGAKRELYDIESGRLAGVSGTPSSLNVESVQGIPYGLPFIRNDVRVSARFSGDQFVYTGGKRTLVIPDFATQNTWFTSLPSRTMDNDSLALLAGQSAFAGLATTPTGDVTAIAGTSKYVYTSRSAWPSGQPNFSQALLDSIPTKAVITTTPFIKSARSSLISGMVAGARRAVPDWSTLAELGGTAPNGIQTLEYATAEGPAAGAALHTPGTLVVAPDSATVYYIADEFDALPLESFAVSDQISARQLVFVSTASVLGYNRTKPPLTPVLLCGGAKYLGLGNGSFRLLAATPNSQTLPATTLSAGRCSAINLGAGQTPTSRPVFVKSPYDSTVWWMNDGTKSAVSGWSALITLNGGDPNPTIAVFGGTAIGRVPTQ
ncbi:lysozyme [Arthrobacter sp. 754]|uniref:lysozyme n=1 Tax=Arthrobacter sp. 754 TaxID=3156315 RepID=UPI0033979881